MGLIIGLIKRLIYVTVFFFIFATLLVLIPNLPPYTNFSKIELESPLPRTGVLAPNGALNNVEKLYKDKLLGPEAFQLFNGEVYTGLATGEIVKISPGGHVTFVTKIGRPCTGINKPYNCGRPLGFEIDEKTNQMYVSDAYFGIWKVDLKTDKKQLLVSPNVEINGRQPKLMNDLVLAKNGDFYWTDSTSDYDLKDGAYSMLSDPSGRLLYYNAAKNESKVLLDNLWFANGVVMSPDNQFLVVSETCRLRLVKYYIDGPKKGKSEIFLAGLPGTPDNLRALPDGSGLLVALYTVYDDNHPLLVRSMSETPVVRKFLARLQRLIEIPFEFLNAQYPNVIFEDIVFNIGHFKSVAGTLPGMSGLLHVDWNGHIVGSYFNTDGSAEAISDAIVFNDKLLTGSPNAQNYIGAVPAPPALKKAFASSKTVPKPAETVTKKTEAKQEQKPVKPKVEETNEVPKVKTITQEVVKPEVKTTTPKPVEKKVEPKTQPPKQVETTSPPPKTTEKTTTPKPAPTKPVERETKPTPKPQTTTTPKPATTTTKPTTTTTKPTTTTPKPTTTTSKPTTTTPNPTMSKPETKPKTEKPAAKSKPVPEQIPIKEEIPSDTIKPSKETLKVIKKEGPTEIPNPNL